MSPKERTSLETLIALALGILGLVWAFGLIGCATPPSQPVNIPAPPLVRY